MPGTFSRFFVEAPGNDILAAHYNGEFDNIITNMTPTGVDDASVNVGAMQAVANPGGVGTESLATNLLGELQRLRYKIKEVIGSAQWYSTPASDLASIDSDLTTAQSDIVDLQAEDVVLAKKSLIQGIANLGLTLSGGVLTLTDATGTALSGSNKGYVVMESVTPGQMVRLEVTSPFSIKDDANASSDFTNLGFGITESANWDTMPFFLYAVNRADSVFGGADGNSSFFISRSPSLKATPSAANSIGDTGAIPVTDAQDSIILMQDVTVANYTSLPVQLIGTITMSWSSSTTDWTVSALVNTATSGGNSGLGKDALDRTFSQLWAFPTAQNGASSNTHLQANGGTAPVFTTKSYNYFIVKNGEMICYIDFDGDGGTDGTGAVLARLSTPATITSYVPPSQLLSIINASASGTNTQEQLGKFFGSAGNSYVNLSFFNAGASDLTSVQNAHFTNGNRTISGVLRFKAFA